MLIANINNKMNSNLAIVRSILRPNFDPCPFNTALFSLRNYKQKFCVSHDFTFKLELNETPGIDSTRSVTYDILTRRFKRLLWKPCNISLSHILVSEHS